MISKRLLVLLFTLFCVSATAFGVKYKQEIKRLYNDLRKTENVEYVVSKAKEVHKEVKKTINTSSPLIAEEKIESPQAYLTVQGIIQYTNIQRENNGLPPLQENLRLNESALVKTKDMFEKQYFEHDSPDGTSAGDLAENAGYKYITVGENLALGNFLNDSVVVQAWMDSPGHRANILNEKYTEIGVGVIQGTYMGKQTWMAVQHFGLPISACPYIDKELSKDIDENNEKLEEMQKELEDEKNELDEMYENKDPEYNEKAKDYNEKVEEYNDLIKETKEMIEEYNEQVEEFNECAE